MLTLTKGFFKPQTGDKGSVWFPAMETNMQKLNDHVHNGTDSQKLTSIALDAAVQTVTSAGWNTPVSGVYEQTVDITAAFPSGISYDTHTLVIRVNDADAEVVYLKTKRITATSFKMYSNDASLAVKILYL